MVAFWWSPIKPVTSIAALAVSLCFVTTAAAGESAQDRDAQASRPKNVSASAQPRSLSPEKADPQFGADPRKVIMERLQNGTRLYHMNGQGAQSISAHLGANGTIEYQCTDKQLEELSREANDSHAQ
jgi:hypothetical protein